jgi:hypothetical protein
VATVPIASPAPTNSRRLRWRIDESPYYFVCGQGLNYIQLLWPVQNHLC